MQLIEFGQIGYVMIQKQIQKKWVDKSMKCIMVGYSDDHSSNTYWMYDPVMNTIKNTWDVHWAAWTQTDLTETMQIFANGTKPMEMAGALAKDQLPGMTMTMEDDAVNVSNDKVGRNDHDDNDATVPVGRNAMGDGTTATSANTMSASTTTTFVAPTAKYVQFCDQPVRRLVQELKALSINTDDASDSESEEPEESVGLPKMLKEALARIDADKWKEAIANKIMNFLK